MKVLVASKNSSKIEGVKNAFEEYFDDILVDGMNVKSDVSEQPKNDEIYDGARNRVNNLIKENSGNYDYFVGLESGMINMFNNWYVVTVSYIKNKDGIESSGMSGAYKVPDKYVSEILEINLGETMKKVFKEETVEGTISLITKGKITRTDLNKESTLIALTSYINENKWRD